MSNAINSEWQSMETAPRDGTQIQAKIPGHGHNNIISWIPGFLNKSGECCYVWAFVGDQHFPDSWSDGVCWEVNENGERSVAPTAWKYPDE